MQQRKHSTWKTSPVSNHAYWRCAGRQHRMQHLQTRQPRSTGSCPGPAAPFSERAGCSSSGWSCWSFCLISRCSTLGSPHSTYLVDGSTAVLKQGGRFVEIGKRDIWAPAVVAGECQDMCYNSLVAVDFLPASVLHSSMSRLSAQLAAGSSHCSAVQPLQFSHWCTISALCQMSHARQIGKEVISTAVAP